MSEGWRGEGLQDSHVLKIARSGAANCHKQDVAGGRARSQNTIEIDWRGIKGSAHFPNRPPSSHGGL